MELGGRGVQEAGDRLRTWVESPEDPEALLDGLRRRWEALLGEAAEVEGDWQAQEDWEHLWRQGLGVRRITPRLVVAPSWDVPETGPDDLLIILDPGMAFGTAEHATTRGCLRLLDRRVTAGDRVVDVGAGSAILSMAAALLGAREVLALEMDELACEAARQNLEANGLDRTVTLRRRVVRGEEPLQGRPWHGIVANLQRLLLLPLLPAFARSLAPGGWLILSGILVREREEMASACRRTGFFPTDEDREGEWWTGAFRLSAD